MRLIDADALGRFSFHIECEEDGETFERCVVDWDDIEDAPTVDAVILPCKPGTTVYEVSNNTDACYDCNYYSAHLNDEDCTNPEHETYYPTIQDFPVCDKHFMEIISYAATEQQLFNSREKFGKTIFLTREEAEAALAKMDK